MPAQQSVLLRNRISPTDSIHATPKTPGRFTGLNAHLIMPRRRSLAFQVAGANQPQL